MGGKVGLAMAIRHPELVRRLAIYGTTYNHSKNRFRVMLSKSLRKSHRNFRAERFERAIRENIARCELERISSENTRIDEGL